MMLDENDPPRRAIVLLLCSEAPAQTTFDFNGYAVELPSYQRVNDVLAQLFNIERNQFLNITRIRLRPSLSLSYSTQLAVEYEIAGTYSSSPSPLAIAPAQQRRQLLHMTWTPITEPTKKETPLNSEVQRDLRFVSRHGTNSR